MTDTTILNTRLAAAEALVQQRQSALTRLEAREELFREELTSFTTELKEKGIDPTKIDELITEAAARVDHHLVLLEQALAGDGQTAEG